ncbi:MAG: ABC transporter ATP-binding protein [Candidatus Omnitrophica bacterium]|nr:ABC transporter ATP-binding protein [Candidatus Omnitrophota bacterium]
MHVSVKKLYNVFKSSLLDQAIFIIGTAFFGRREKIMHGKGNVIAADNISFNIREGERVGIIGRNGAGKTTLLRTIAGLAQPTLGRVNVDGKVTCTMTLGVGLKGDLTGRENIYLDGEINGKSKSIINRVIDNIITFADIGDFIDRPVRTYSTGMRMRLAFSMLTYLEPEVLIIDELLSVGDVQFMLKSASAIRKMCDKGKIVIMASHNMGDIKQICNRCIWLDRGKVVMDGNPEEVTSRYLESIKDEEEKGFLKRFDKLIKEQSSSQDLNITKLDFLDSMGKRRFVFNVGEEMRIRISVSSKNRVKNTDLRISFIRPDDILLMENLASKDGFTLGNITDKAEFEIYMDKVLFGKNIYEVKAELFNKETKEAMATRYSMLKVDNPECSFDNPAFFQPVNCDIDEAKEEEICRF